MSNNHAAARALATDELLSQILGYFGATPDRHADYDTLANLRGVNRRFLATADRIEWEYPSPEDLADVPPHRRQYCANFVRRLNFDDHWGSRVSALPHINNLAYPRLSILHANARTENPVSIQAFIQGTLKELYLRQIRVSDDLLGIMANRCSNLRTLILGDTNYGHSQTADLIAVLQNNPRLENVHLGSGLRHLITPEVTRQLSGMNRLLSLQLRLSPDHFQTPSPLTTGYSPFPSLEKLGIKGNCEPILALLGALRGDEHSKLRHLRLELTDFDDSIFRAVGRLSNLQSLQIVGRNQVSRDRFDLWDLAELAPLGQLTHLDIGGFVARGTPTEDWTFNLFSYFPRLVELSLGFDVYLGVEALRSVALNCPLLKALRLPGMVHIQSLGYPPARYIPGLCDPVFQNLTHLIVDEVDDMGRFDEETAEYLLDILDFHAIHFRHLQCRPNPLRTDPEIPPASIAEMMADIWLLNRPH